MSNLQANPSDLFETIHSLVTARINGELTPETFARLDSLLVNNAAARRLYVQYIYETLALPMFVSTEAGEKCAPSLNPGCADNNFALPMDVFAADDPRCASKEPRLASFPAPTFLSSAFPATLGFSSGWPVAYMVATVVTGLWLLSMWLTPVSRQVATHSMPPAAERQLAPEPVPVSVGRITGLVDCQWNGSSRVSLGQKIALASGLMEIAYDTGAKVILQGPVTYEVESNGGYLSLGKLTGKLEHSFNREPAASVSVASKSEISNQKSEMSAFAVRTPTATVIDLGTEFGVEVGKDGVTNTHVFLGEVQIVTGSGKGNADRQTQVISAGQSARVGHNDAISVGKEDAGEIAKRFTRGMPSPQRALTSDDYAKLVLSLNPAVYYRMEEWPKTGKEDHYVLVDSAPGGHHGEICAGEGFDDASWPGKKHGNSLRLQGAMGKEEYAVVRGCPATTSGQLSASVWIWAADYDGWPAIVGNSEPATGRPGRFLFGVDSDRRLYIAVQDDRGSSDSREEAILPRGVWQHVACVADGSTLRLYRNGAEVAAQPCRKISRDTFLEPLGIGCLIDAPRNGKSKDDVNYHCHWNGWLDEIAIFHHALSAEQVRQLAAGSPAVTTSHTRRPSTTGEKKGGNDKP